MKRAQWVRQVSINRQVEASGHHDSFIHSVCLYWASYVPNTLPLSAKGTVDSAAGLSLSAAVGTSPSHSPTPICCQTPTEAPPAQLPQEALLAWYQPLQAPRSCLIHRIVTELGSDMSDSFLWVWLAWVTSRHPGSLNSVPRSGGL